MQNQHRKELHVYDFLPSFGPYRNFFSEKRSVNLWAVNHFQQAWCFHIFIIGCCVDSTHVSNSSGTRIAVGIERVNDPAGNLKLSLRKLVEVKWLILTWYSTEYRNQLKIWNSVSKHLFLLHTYMMAWKKLSSKAYGGSK